MSIEAVEGVPRSPWWRTALLVVIALLGSLVSVALSPAAWAMTIDTNGPGFLITLLAFILAVAGPIALIWRNRIPVVLTVAAAVASVLVPIGNTLPWIALACMIGRRRGSGVWAVAGLVGITSFWVVFADAAAEPRDASVLKSMISSSGTPGLTGIEVGFGVTLTVALLGWGLSVVAGLLARSVREKRVAAASSQADRATSSVLADEVARRQEREQIAREVHDVLGHRLSLLSLHAGALEANAKDNEQLKASAALVRQSAGGAMDDLRSLLAMLREPTPSHPDLPLTELPRVVEESFGAGQLLSSSIFIEDAAGAAPALARAVYRIVQELLTNARKHAPGQRVLLDVRGGPATGVAIDVRNPLAPGTAAKGAGRGLTGIAERAELLGGTLQHGLDDGGVTFRVRVELPWQ